MARSLAARSGLGRLRLWLTAFFLAVAVPSAVLVAHGYQQLKWEAFHQQRLLAEDVTARVDATLVALLQAERGRGFDDYAFAMRTGDSDAGLVQRSPLAALPASLALPGLVGYFQVDADGALSTPLLPPDDAEAARYGLGAAELEQRSKLEQEVAAILGRNRLVVHGGPRPGSPPAPDTARGAAVATPEAFAEELTQAIAKTLATGARGRPERRREATASSGSDASLEAQPQAAFDRLAESKPARSPRPDGGSATRLGRLDDLELKAPFEDRAVAQRAVRPEREADRVDSAGPREPSAGAARASRQRLERSVARGDAAGRSMRARDWSGIAVRAFEAEVGPFEFRLLESGHFVLFRRVWRDGQRLVQGALIAQAPFLESVVERAFRGSAAARASNLAVAWQGDVLAAFGGESAARYLYSAEQLGGALLHRARLSAPFAELELVFTVTRLPAGAGARIIAWSAGVLALVLCVGIWLLYRTGARQLALARQQQDFVSAVSHELRTPLTSIRMYAEMLREGWASEQKKRGYYDYIVDESERLSRLIDNVLQLARITRGELQVSQREIRVSELIDASRSRLESQAQAAGFELHIECEPGIGDRRLRVDPDAFSQIVINLVDNALKFSADGVRRRVEFGCRSTEDGGVAFSVRDFGPGIARDQRRKIFQLFYRAGGRLTRETAGTGIGLALVSQLARAMRAEITVADAEPGARLTVAFPAATPRS